MMRGVAYGKRAKAVEQIAILRTARDTMRRMEPPGLR
jgi:hypothetical protein